MPRISGDPTLDPEAFSSTFILLSVTLKLEKNRHKNVFLSEAPQFLQGGKNTHLTTKKDLGTTEAAGRRLERSNTNDYDKNSSPVSEEHSSSHVILGLFEATPTSCFDSVFLPSLN